MFIKPFKIKSSVQLKGSDSKKLRGKISRDFPHVTEADLNNLVPNKSTVTLVKLIAYSGTNCNVHAIEKRPMFLDCGDDKLIPTVYALWLAPNLVPYFTTHPPVLPKLGNGADLMLPGVIRQGTGLGSYGHYKKDQLMGVNLTSNKAAVGIGRLTRSSDDLYMSGGHGSCVKMIHLFGDKLWGLEPSVVLQIPQFEAIMEVPKDDDFPELGVSMKKPTVEHNAIMATAIIDNEIAEKATNLQIDNEEATVDAAAEPELVLEKELDMDTVLQNAFLTALKSAAKSLVLPVLTSNFYRLHVIPAAEKQIDLKQTSYKKFSKFLNEMTDKGFIVVREETKGVEKIVSVDFEHPDLVNFIPTASSSDKDSEAKAQLFHSAMTELYIVTEETVPFFTKLNFKRGDGIAAAQIKKILKEYVSKSQLPYVANSKQIRLDAALSAICGQETAIFDDLYQTILSRMHHTYEMRSKKESSSNKPPIQMTLATRSGNKKVTLVSNLEAYGIIVSEFAKACKVGAAASTSIVSSPHQKQEQFQVQGNQVRFLYNLLTETYKIPPKQIQGLDLAKKEKKKK